MSLDYTFNLSSLVWHLYHRAMSPISTCLALWQDAVLLYIPIPPFGFNNSVLTWSDITWDSVWPGQQSTLSKFNSLSDIPVLEKAGPYIPVNIRDSIRQSWIQFLCWSTEWYAWRIAQGWIFVFGPISAFSLAVRGINSYNIWSHDPNKGG